MPNLSNKLSFYTMLLIALVLVFLRMSTPQRNYLAYDNFGYYLYLPSLFIEGDLGIPDISYLDEINEEYNATPTYYQIELKNGNHIIRFFMGMSILLLPFFFIGHVIALMTPYAADGFSAPYQMALILGGLFYTLLGLFFMRKILLRFVNDRISSLVLILLYLGSIQFFFIAYGNDMPHVYIFNMYALIIWLTIKWHEKQKMKYAVLLGLVLGVTILARPSELIALAIPVFWGVYDKKTLIARINLFWEKRIQILATIGCMAFFGMLQIVYWRIYTGKFLYFAYTDPGSGFEFLNPRFWFTLFGYRKGWFVYSPLMFFAMIGIVVMYKKKREYFLPFFLFFVFTTYAIASYTSLISYGYRAFVEAQAIMAIPLAILIKELFKPKKIWLYFLVAVFAIALLGYTQFLSWQIKNNIIDGSRMTQQYYWSVFGKTRVSEEDRKLLLVKRPVTTEEYFTEENDYKRSILANFTFEPEYEQNILRDSSNAHSGQYSFRLDKNNQFSPGIDLPYFRLTDKDHVWLRTSAWIFPIEDLDNEKITLAISFKYKGRDHKYRCLRYGQDKLITGQWNKLEFDYISPEMRSNNEVLKVYVWHPGKTPILVDDLKVEVFEPKH
jgi:hypothetical protein